MKPRAGLDDRGQGEGDASPPPIIVPYVVTNNDNKDNNDNNDINSPEATIKMLTNLKATLKAKLDPGDYIIENLSHVIKIHTNNSEVHTKVRNLLKGNFEYHTHSFPIDGPKLKKFVIYDLCDSDTGEILDDLNSYGLDPVDIKKMHIKFPRFPGHANYLVYFDDADKISLPMVEKAKFVCHTKVRWAHYNTKTTQVRQCSNCYRFGHLKYGCEMKVVCFLCANHHPVDECPLMIRKRETNADRISSQLLKCTNCKGKHTAIDQSCPSRINFVNKKPGTTKRGPPPINTPRTYKPAPTPNNNAWTSRPAINNHQQAATPTRPKQRQLEQRSHSPQRNERIHKTTPRSRTITFQSPAPMQRKMRAANHRHQLIDDNNEPTSHESHTKDIVLNSITSIQNNSHKTSQHRNPQLNFTQATNSDDVLFSPQELSKIFQEMVNKVSKCKDKNEQLNALMNIALKYMPCLE